MNAEHPDLPLEQAHIDRAAAALRAMQESARADVVRPSEGGSMRMTDRARREQAERRLERLLDASDGVCFGRIDTTDGQIWHVGIQHIREGIRPLVISFESEVGGRFIDATVDDPQDLKRRRRFNVVDGTKLLSLHDEVLDGSEPAAGHVHDAILESLEAERSSHMRHIAATIERTQNRLIRFDRSGVLVVQGGPGTGKTAVALHRASWLAFNFASTLGQSGGILVVGPNPTFMAYIKSVLPGLGKRFITQLPVGSIASARGKAKDSAEAAALKGDARMAQVIRQAAFSRIRPPEDDATIPFGGVEVLLPAARLKDLIRRAKGHARPYSDGRAAFRRLAGELFGECYSEGPGGSAGEDVESFLNQRSGPWFNFVQRVWPRIAPEQLVHELYSVESRRRAATERLLLPHEVDLLVRPRVEKASDQRWTAADAVLIDEAEFVLRGSQAGWRYVIIDEAQDLTPMQLRMVGRRSATGDLTLVGDLAQATGAFQYASWDEVLAHVGSAKPAMIEHLDVGYRVPEEVLRYAARLLPEIAPQLEPTAGVRSTEDPWIEQVDEDIGWHVASYAAELVYDSQRTLGIIAPNSYHRDLRAALAEEDVEFGTARDGLRKRVALLAAEDVKGLEFDHVVVVEPSAIVTESGAGLAGLYVALTRPTQTLSVFHEQPLPRALSERG